MLDIQSVKILTYRSIIVTLKPLGIIILSNIDKNQASLLALVYIISSISTATLSASIYKHYIKEAIEAGFDKVKDYVFAHTYFVIIFFFIISLFFSQKFNWIFLYLIIDFFFHQLSRIYLYKKNFFKWFIFNLNPMFAIFLLMLFHLYYIKFFLYFLFLFSLLNLIYKDGFFKFKKIYDQSIIKDYLFGISKKFYFQADKLFIGIFYNQEIFWLIALMYQISSLSNTLFDTFFVMPNKKNIALKKFKIKLFKLKKINYISLVFYFIPIVLVNLYYKNFISLDLLIFSIILLFRIYLLNELNIFLEIFFWSNKLFKSSVLFFFNILLIFFAVYLIIESSFQFEITFCLTIYLLILFLLSKYYKLKINN